MKAEKIKILEAIRQGKVGGGETHVLELCSNMDRDKYEPVVLSFTPGPMVDELNRRGIRTKVISTEKAFDFKVWKQVLDFIKEEKFQIIHAHGTRANSNVFWAAGKLNLPLVYTVHGWSFHQDQSFLVRYLRELSEKFLTRKAKINICVSKSNENDGIKLLKMKRSQVISMQLILKNSTPKSSLQISGKLWELLRIKRSLVILSGLPNKKIHLPC
jgi:glycosyltransferase involved in cell wall biosynthesis